MAAVAELGGTKGGLAAGHCDVRHGHDPAGTGFSFAVGAALGGRPGRAGAVHHHAVAGLGLGQGRAELTPEAERARSAQRLMDAVADHRRSWLSV